MPPETKPKQEQKKGKKRKVEDVEEVGEVNPTEPESTESEDERGEVENISSDSENESEATRPEKVRPLLCFRELMSAEAGKRPPSRWVSRLLYENVDGRVWR